MDNFHIDVTCQGSKPMLLALEIAFTNCPGSKAIGYRVIENKGLVLYWTEADNVTPFLSKMTFAEVEPIIQGWLKEQDYGEQPDHDGSNGKGWRVYNEAWGHVNNEWEAFVAIEPAWAMYGK